MSAIVSWSRPPVKVLTNLVFGSNLVEASIFLLNRKSNLKVLIRQLVWEHSEEVDGEIKWWNDCLASDMR